MELSDATAPVIGPKAWKIPDEEGNLTVRGTVGGLTLARHFELIEHLHCKYLAGDPGSHRKKFLARLAAENGSRAAETIISAFSMFWRAVPLK